MLLWVLLISATHLCKTPAVWQHVLHLFAETVLDRLLPDVQGIVSSAEKAAGHAHHGPVSELELSEQAYKVCNDVHDKEVAV